MIRFNDDDQSYLAWIAAHPRGYVLNIRHEPDPKYVVLHRATCPSISIDRHAEGRVHGQELPKVLRRKRRSAGDHCTASGKS
jgi:hypothetical protein